LQAQMPSCAAIAWAETTTQFGSALELVAFVPVAAVVWRSFGFGTIARITRLFFS